MAKKSHKLNDQHRAFLVRQLACYATPAEAVEALKEAFGIEIAPQAAEVYDPTKKAGSKKWEPLFNEIRKSFLEHVEKHIPLANKAVRLRKLSKAAAAFEGQRNYIGMADMLERIAKELGNVHTNRREHTGKDGGPVQYRNVHEMSDEELEQEWARLVEKYRAQTEPADPGKQH